MSAATTLTPAPPPHRATARHPSFTPAPARHAAAAPQQASPATSTRPARTVTRPAATGKPLARTASSNALAARYRAPASTTSAQRSHSQSRSQSRSRASSRGPSTAAATAGSSRPHTAPSTAPSIASTTKSAYKSTSSATTAPRRRYAAADHYASSSPVSSDPPSPSHSPAPSPGGGDRAEAFGLGQVEATHKPRAVPGSPRRLSDITLERPTTSYTSSTRQARGSAPGTPRQGSFTRPAARRRDGAMASAPSTPRRGSAGSAGFSGLELVVPPAFAGLDAGRDDGYAAADAADARDARDARHLPDGVRQLRLTRLSLRRQMQSLLTPGDETRSARRY